MQVLQYNALFKKISQTDNLIDIFKKIADELDYPIFRKNSAYPINLNIWGIRSNERDTKHFNDVIVFFYESKKNTWVVKFFEATTDPSDLSLKNPINSKGCAILREGYHKALWKIGKHKGEYTALVQANPCAVIRDNNRDDKIDISDNTDFGMFGINLHRASSWKVSDEIGLYSAGCQVIKDVNMWKGEILPLITKAVGNGTQSYILINKNDLIYNE